MLPPVTLPDAPDTSFDSRSGFPEIPDIEPAITGQPSLGNSAPLYFSEASGFSDSGTVKFLLQKAGTKRGLQSCGKKALATILMDPDSLRELKLPPPTGCHIITHQHCHMFCLPRSLQVSFRVFSFVFAIHWAGTSALAADFVQPEPLDPEVAPASQEGEQAMAAFKIQEGWSISQFAAEPDVANVVAFDIDNRGRVFVCESFRQGKGVTDNRSHDKVWLASDLAATTVQDRIDYHKRLLGDSAITFAQQDDRVRRLVDSNGDDKADQSTVIANGFNHLEEGTGAGVLAIGSDIYYTCIPKLWKLIDADDDGIADERVVLSDGYGVRVAFRGHDAHGLIVGPDGRLYFSIGDRGYNITTSEGEVLADPASGAVFRCELDGSKLEVFAKGLRNPQELAFNSVGDLFTVDNNSDSGDQARIVQVVENSDSGWRMHYQYLGDRGIFNREKVWHPLHDEQTVAIVPPIANFTDGPSGLAYYPGTGFGSKLDDQFLICDFRGGAANSGIRSFKLKYGQGFYSLESDAQPIWQVLATDVKFSPDGSLFLSDWVDGWNGIGKGRLYRITDDDHHKDPIVAEVEELLESDWSERDLDSLAKDLSHIDQRVRQRSQFELARRDESDRLISIASNLDRPMLARLHAIWGCEQIARRTPSKLESITAAVRGLTGDSVPEVASAAINVLGSHGSDGDAPSLLELLDAESNRIRQSVLLALTKLGYVDEDRIVADHLASWENKDPILRHRAIVYLATCIDPQDLASLKDHPSAFVRRCAVAALGRTKSVLVTNYLGDSDSLVVAEAARAIHDQPIPAAYPALSAKLVESNDKGFVWSEEFAGFESIRRAMNATYRMGDKDAAGRLGAFAASASAATPVRIEALDYLLSWSDDSPIDRYDSVHRPTPEREVDHATSALEPHVDTLLKSPDEVRAKAIDAASVLGIARIAPNLIAQISDSDLSPAQRANSLAALSRLSARDAVKLARGIGLESAAPLLKASMLVLSEHASEDSIEMFIEASRSRNEEVSQLAWDLLAKSSAPSAVNRIREGIDEHIAGTLLPSVELNVLEASEGKLDDERKLQLEEYQAELSKKDSLGQYLVALEGGNIDAGSKLFFEKTELSCVRCHRVDRAGGEVGPVLTKIGLEKERRYLLEAICQPDAVIAKGFESAIIVDDSGNTSTGIVASENDESVILIQNDGTRKRIYQDEIVARKKGNSSMPADLTKYMTKRELRDLVAYLASLKVDPREVEKAEIE
jgi:quinoprotein glucose dehydrogenase